VALKQMQSMGPLKQVLGLFAGDQCEGAAGCIDGR